MVKRITLALCLCVTMQAQAVQVKPAKEFVRLCLASGASLATLQYLTDETIHRVINRLHDTSVKQSWVGRTKAKADFWKKLDENKVFIYNGTRIVCSALAHQVVLGILQRTPILS